MSARTRIESRLAAGDRLHMQISNGKRCWWFEQPRQDIPDRLIMAMIADDHPVIRDAGDSLFGLPLNSQTFISAQ